MEKEIWKDIEWYEWHYQVSSFGSVKSYPRATTKWIILKPWNNHWYYRLTLSKKWKSKNYRVHRIVAEAFIQNNKNLPQVNHINGIKHDNRVENLEWCSGSENSVHAFKMGKCTHPFKSSWENILARKIVQMDKKWSFIKEWCCISDASKSIWASWSSICHALRGRTKTCKWFTFKYL